MSASLEWTEWHLTASGWFRGTTKSETQMTSVAGPVGSVATYQYIEEHSGYGKGTERTQRISGPNVNEEEFERLIGLHGGCSQHL